MSPTPTSVVICRTVAEMHQAVFQARSNGHTIGCIPTMGSLHQGHASLVRVAAERHNFVVASIFVNPTQFGPSEDFERYPRNVKSDLVILQQAGATHVFLPSIQEMYPVGVASTIHITGVTEVLEGASRPNHFEGVATVVARLFQAMLPDEAFFGQKDLQQTLVIKALVAASSDNAVARTKITVLPTVREHDGLAMSSRNVYLSAEHRQQATVLYRALVSARNMISAGETSRIAVEQEMLGTLSKVGDLTIDYAVAVDADTLRCPTDDLPHTIALCVAVRLGNTRLIDNMLVEHPR
ncbi:MAG: pantoate--beta-alanine ligase [Ignavibacteria bacterium]|nr:pantoate--beta-alanine ligase [Ignavibacteria bacterium]